MAIRPFVNRSSGGEQLLIEGACEGQHVAVPLIAPEEQTAIDQMRLAVAVAAGDDGEVHFIDPSGHHETHVIDTTTTNEADVLAHVREWCESSELPSGVLSGRVMTRRIVSTIENRDIDTAVLPGDLGRGALGRRRHKRIASALPCDVVSINGEGRYREFASILVPTAGGPHTGLAIDVATRIANSLDAWIDVLHVLPEEADEALLESAESHLAEATNRIGRPDTVNPWLLRSDDPADTIIEQSAYYGLTVIGAPTSSRLTRFVHGSTSQEIREEAESVVIAARTPNGS